MATENDSKNTAMNAGSDLRVGFSSITITPAEPVWLYGYASPQRQQPYAGKIHDLYVNAMACEDAAGGRVVLVTLDLCVMRKREAEQVMARLMNRTGLPPERILINLSHTHSGPMIGTEDPQRYPLPPVMQSRIAEYTHWLIERVAESAAKALADLRPAEVSWGRGRVSFVRNRRKYGEDGRYAGMGANPDGYSDPRVTVLRVTDPDGTIRGIISSLACHAVTLGPKNLMLCGDYPAFAKHDLAERHPHAVPLFVQGCGADANTYPRATPDQMEWARRHGRELADEVDRVMAGPLAPVRGPIGAGKEWLDLPLLQQSRQELEAGLKGPSSVAQANARRIMELINRGEIPPVSHRAMVGLWRFGNDLTLVALPGETVSGYAVRMEEIVNPDRLWVAGYCDEVFGYLPNADIVREGGYENRGLVREVGQFDAAVEDVVVDGVRRLALSVHV